MLTSTSTSGKDCVSGRDLVPGGARVIRYRIDLAGPEDDADLRHILAATPMPGQISVCFRREPSYFEGAHVDGRFRQVLAARNVHTGRLVGFGCRSLMPRFVNGHPQTVGYLSGLRILSEHRNRGLMARGHAYFRRLHQDGRTRLYLVTIVEGNRTALELLTSGRAGLPAYYFAGRYHTMALPVARRPSPTPHWGGIRIQPAKPQDITSVVALLRAEGPRRQFFPVYAEEDFVGDDGIFKDLRVDQILLAWRGDQLVGLLAGWDQIGFRQTVVHGYGPLTGALHRSSTPGLAGVRSRPCPRWARRFAT